ncbi:Delta l-pyrroline-5-carboxylate synthetase [Trema orientale]|uniref:Delta-1-pyrroline-5-carboxylate synthase n=1 Tax=Trema orientale TaxID=63057 RepID=A0A2P5EZ40_TREOI|nr:Delta l-pyrroline-5-carboxylate synthetase [Trema orientale]
MVIMVGTAVVTRGDGRLALGRLGALCEQLKELLSQDYEVILVTSGAVGLGRQRLKYRRLANTSFADLQYLQGEFDDGKACASVGQGSLMALYDTMFSQLDVTSSQLLVTDGVFRDEAFKKQLTDTVNSLVSLRVIPIFNENDAVSTRREPLMDSSGIFWDNDSLAGLLAQELNADLLVLLSDVEGLYSGPPSDPKSKLIHTYVKEKHQEEITFGDKSRLGRGGMTAKVNAAVSAAYAGIPVVITSGYATDNIIKVLQGKRVGTVFHKDAHLWPVVKEVCAREMAVAARECSTRLQALGSQERRKILLDIADALEANESLIKAENQADIAAAIEAEKEKALLSRLTLKPGKISSLARSVRKLADMEEPIGLVSGRSELADGVILERVSCPLGVLLVVFESRPDALVQIASLAIRTGNGLLLKGETDAKRSNAIFHKVITSAIPSVVGDDLIGLVTSREEIPDLLKLEDVIDLVIPRGNKNLVSQIKESTKIPVLGHAGKNSCIIKDGVCYVYIDKSANLDMARSIVLDAKLAYPADSNAMKKLLIHKDLPSNGGFSELVAELQHKGVSLYGGPKASTLLSIAEASPFHLEYNKVACTVEIVEDIFAAIDHIHQNGSALSDSIVTEDREAAEVFLSKVDRSALCHNGSTISCNGGSSEHDAKVEITSKPIHIRDPVGVEGLLTTQWVMRGNGKKVVNGYKGINHTIKQELHLKA